MIRVDPLSGLKAAVGDGEPETDASPDLFSATASAGAHEVLSTEPLSALSPTQLTSVAEEWRERMRAHGDAACLHLCAAEGPDAAVTQLYALDFVPAAVARERERFGAYAIRTMGSNLLADLVQEEVRRRVRVVAIDDEAVLMTPFASRVPYQLMLAPRRPRARFEDEGPTGAALLHDALARLRRRLDAVPLDLWVRTAPQGADSFCWRIDVLPRLGHPSGLELGVGVPLCDVAPETAAAELAAA